MAAQVEQMLTSSARMSSLTPNIKHVPAIIMSDHKHSAYLSPGCLILITCGHGSKPRLEASFSHMDDLLGV